MTTNEEHGSKRAKRASARREPTAPGVITRKKAAEMLGKSIRTIDLWIDKGILPATRVAGSVFINEADVMALVPAQSRPKGDA